MAPKAAAGGEAKKKKAPKKEAEEEDTGPKMEPPNKAEFEAGLAEIQTAIDGLQAQQQELGKKISERSGGKDEYFAKRNEYRAQLDEFTAKIDALMARKGEINDGINAKKQEGADMRNQLSKMKKSIGYTSEADIDQRIADIEFKLCVESLTIKQEKEFLKEISELKRNRPKVGQVHKMEDSLANRDTGANARETISTINEEMALYRDGKRQVSQQLAALNESRKEQLGDLPNYIEQRDALGKQIKEQMDKRNVLRDEFRQKEREYNAWRNEQRKAKQEKYMEEQNKKKAEWEQQSRVRKAEAMDQQPYVSEITLIEQTLLWCKNQVQEKTETAKEEKKATDHTNKDGEMVLLSKDQREEEFYYAPTATKKKGKNKKAAGGSAKPIKHNAETFKLFDQLKLNAPITTEDIPALVEKLEAQLESYNQKVKDWERDRDEKKKQILEGTYKEEKEEAAEAPAEEKADE